MLETQKYLLSGKTFEDLKKELGIEITLHSSLPLAILNYSQINSKPRNHSIVKECRALCLNTENFSLISRSFFRFFNLGEYQDEIINFDWSNFKIQRKIDGSLVTIAYYNNEWHGHTRGSFGFANIGFENFSWREAFLKGMNINSWNDLDKILDRKLAYTCEFGSIWNKVVEIHKNPIMYLLSVFDGERELSWEEYQNIKNKTSSIFTFPAEYEFKSIEEIQNYLDGIQNTTFEGVVIRDINNNRWKIKRKEYLALHSLRGEGNNLFNPKYIIPFILKKETEELENYFPEVKQKLYEIEELMNNEFRLLNDVWQENKHIESQKEFAQSILGKTKFSGMLLNARKLNKPIDEIWRDSGDLILKILF